MAMNRHFCIILLALALIVAPAIASNNYDYQSPYESKYAAVPLDANEIQSRTTGLLTISITTAGCLDADSSTYVVAAYRGEYISEGQVGVNGIADLRLEPGDYFVRLAKGTGSAHDANTWKAEEQTVHISAGQRAYVTFIGSGSPCGLTAAQPEPEPELNCPQISDEELVDGFYEKNQWLHFTLENLNDFPMFVNIKYKVSYLSGTQHRCTPGTSCYIYYTWEPATYQSRDRFFAWPGPSSQYAFIWYRQYHKDERIEYVTVTGCEESCWGEEFRAS